MLCVSPAVPRLDRPPSQARPPRVLLSIVCGPEVAGAGLGICRLKSPIKAMTAPGPEPAEPYSCIALQACHSPHPPWFLEVGPETVRSCRIPCRCCVDLVFAFTFGQLPVPSVVTEREGCCHPLAGRASSPCVTRAASLSSIAALPSVLACARS